MPSLSADGSSEWVPAKGPFHLHLSNDFGGGTATVQFKDVDGNIRSITNASFIAAVDKLISTGFNTDVRVTLVGSTSPDLDYNILTHAP